MSAAAPVYELIASFGSFGAARAEVRFYGKNAEPPHSVFWIVGGIEVEKRGFYSADSAYFFAEGYALGQKEA